VGITCATVLKAPKPLESFIGNLIVGQFSNIKWKGQIFDTMEEKGACINFVQQPHPLGQGDQKIKLE
jgi:hypothetical protein